MTTQKLSMSNVKELAAAVAKEEKCPALEQFLLDYMKLRYASDPEKRKSLKLPVGLSAIKPKCPWNTINIAQEKANISSPKNGGRWGYLHAVMNLPSTVSQASVVEYAAKLRPGEQSALLNFITGHHVSYEAYTHGITVHEAQALLDSALLILNLHFKEKQDLATAYKEGWEPLYDHVSRLTRTEAGTGKTIMLVSQCKIPHTTYLMGVNDRAAFPSMANYLDFDNLKYYYAVSKTGGTFMKSPKGRAMAEKSANAVAKLVNQK